MADTKVVADGLFTGPPDDPRLIATACAGCGLVAFPAATACLRCGGARLDERLLAPRGTLWTFTTQGFRPPSPPYDADDEGHFAPFAVGYVELPDGILVEARLTEADPARLRIGQPMRLVLVPYTRDGEGRDVLTFAFAPDGSDRPDGEGVA
jgi:uncharacterized protein